MFNNMKKIWRYFLLYKRNKHLYDKIFTEGKEVILAYKRAKMKESAGGTKVLVKEMKDIYKEGLDVLESLEPILDLLIED